MARKEQRTTYYGRRVIITCERWVAGGIACDVERAPEETDWPWTVQRFTVNRENLKLVRA